MYNLDFLQQIEDYKSEIFGLRDSWDIAEFQESIRVYAFPSSVKLSDCYKDINTGRITYPARR